MRIISISYSLYGVICTADYISYVFYISAEIKLFYQVIHSFNKSLNSFSELADI